MWKIHMFIICVSAFKYNAMFVHYYKVEITKIRTSMPSTFPCPPFLPPTPPPVPVQWRTAVCRCAGASEWPQDTMAREPVQTRAGTTFCHLGQERQSDIAFLHNGKRTGKLQRISPCLGREWKETFHSHSFKWKIFMWFSLVVVMYIWVKRTRMDIMQISVTFFSTSELKYTHLKTGPIISKNM